MPYQYASSTCIAVSASTTDCLFYTSTSSPLVVQDAGNVTFGLGWLVFFAAMIFLGMVWNIVPFLRHDR